MQFIVLPIRGRPARGSFGVYLEQNNWDDFGFRTLFRMFYADGQEYFSVGFVKIAHVEMINGGATPLPAQFVELPEGFFSLGQDISYYSDLKTLGSSIRETVLKSLRDVAYDRELFRQVESHPAMRRSLLRDQVDATVVTGQYHRVATGGRTHIEQQFSYVASDGLTLDFDVAPGSQPPTNVHVLIGSNGVGKTQLLNDIARAAARPTDKTNAGYIRDHQQDDAGPFVNVISISFSAFDLLRPVQPENGVNYVHVTLDRNYKPNGRTPAKQFAEVLVTLVGERQRRWFRALETLGADPLLRDALVALTTDGSASSSEVAEAVFDGLSSGHKIVTLAISYLVDLVTEGTLVLIDEPETHLHPPLLASFVRALSDLLIDRNGVAIIATHSPVVLQETPRSCVWKMYRVGDRRTALRPELETFGENVGTLTREAFGLEITRSGFHRRLAEAVSTNLTYEEVLSRFHGQLGIEARAIVRALIASRDRGGH